jgi:hypothetical protein
MKINKWQTALGILLIILSIIVYIIHYLIFRDPHHILIYLIGDIAFVFFEVLLVTLVIHSLLNRKELHEKLEKLNMLIGVFFSNIGIKLLTLFSDADPNLDNIKKMLLIDEKWSNNNFNQISKILKKQKYKIDIKKIDLKELKEFIIFQGDFLTRLLENPVLYEHESFTELLRTVFHLYEELVYRKNIIKLIENDRNHIKIDIERCYKHLVIQWINYMQHLKNNYPYLFSLSMRTNPFDENATIQIKNKF